MFGHDGWNYMWGWHMWFGLVVFVVIVVVLWKLLGASSGSSAKSPREILDERYAKAEIDKEEFEQRKQELLH